ncbi:alpha/beta hydrolase [Burkholderia mallei]|uniref:Alpha/beta hydrolase n=1 Tax=Burkholderia mallei TaxID=13373 RepID=A0AAX1X561_BURML|nr:hydrolase, alpha/beta fold family [Burkholderia mallei SAVP1]EEP87641.1 conserved domain protein [Burkholderia mallei GB8 horse 4]QCU28795.1 alpha/beta hydrolase [Burkholderia pseudomallei]RKO02515.1 alpha/beta hydrolase [Burkholderia mallei]RKO06828.1 alpha/beta hydrolase [Burkholderia mallei]
MAALRSRGPRLEKCLDTRAASRLAPRRMGWIDIIERSFFFWRLRCTPPNLSPISSRFAA